MLRTCLSGLMAFRNTWREWPPLAQILTILLPAQALLWLFILSLWHQPLPAKTLDTYRVRSVQLALTHAMSLAEAETLAAQSPQEGLREGRLPFGRNDELMADCGRHHTSPTLWIRFEKNFKPTDPPQGLLTSYLRDNYLAYVNGHQIAYPQGVFVTEPSRHGRKPTLLGLTPHMLKDGANRFDILVRTNGCLPRVTGVMVAPYHDLQRFQAWATRSRVDTAVAVLSICLVVACLSALLSLFGNSRGLHLGIGAMFLLQAGIQFDHIWFSQAIGFFDRALLVSGLMAASLLTCMYVADRWTGSNGRTTNGLILGLGIIHLALIALSYALDQLLLIDLKSLVTGGIALSYVAFRTFTYFRTDPRDATWLLATISILIAGQMISDFASLFSIPVRVNPLIAVPLAVTVTTAAYLALRALGLYADTEAARHALVVELAAKENELRRHERRATLYEERERLIADMHDGLGGQLASLMARLRLRDVPRDEMRQSLQDIVDDLRLVINSMDQVGTTLSEALGLFRQRLEPRLQSLGITLDWTDHLSASLSGFRPQDLLQLYRILQEASANAIKHAAPTRLSFHLASTAQGQIRIAITDDGPGLLPDLKPGRGLANMQRRAQGLGGTLTFEPGNPGLTVCLEMAAPAPLA